jgi:hypothetical protein
MASMMMVMAMPGRARRRDAAVAEDGEAEEAAHVGEQEPARAGAGEAAGKGIEASHVHGTDPLGGCTDAVGRIVCPTRHRIEHAADGAATARRQYARATRVARRTQPVEQRGLPPVQGLTLVFVPSDDQEHTVK